MEEDDEKRDATPLEIPEMPSATKPTGVERTEVIVEESEFLPSLRCIDFIVIATFASSTMASSHLLRSFSFWQQKTKFLSAVISLIPKENGALASEANAKFSTLHPCREMTLLALLVVETSVLSK